MDKGADVIFNHKPIISTVSAQQQLSESTEKVVDMLTKHPQININSTNMDGYPCFINHLVRQPTTLIRILL